MSEPVPAYEFDQRITGKRLPTPKVPAGQGDLTGVDGLASEHPALACSSPESPTPTRNPAGVSPNALFPSPSRTTQPPAGPSAGLRGNPAFANPKETIELPRGIAAGLLDTTTRST